MTTAGILFMGLSWTIILGFNGLCFYRLSTDQGASGSSHNEPT
jgi:hypothetical protein